jgi:DNA-binding transcriptional ArsR family regulator
VNAYSADFVHGLEALSQSLSQVLAKLDGNAPSNWDDMTGTAIMIPDQGSHARQTPWPATRPPLPDPRLIRRIIRQRQLRSRFFAAELFADPVWDMLLDLTAATAEHRRISVTSLCLASGVPPTTALRWISVLENAGLVERQHDSTDKRRAFITLSDTAISQIARYFETIGPNASSAV